MANGFDRKGAVLGVALLFLFVVVGAAVLLARDVHITVQLPPVQQATR
jgi:hypothetical protein